MYRFRRFAAVAALAIVFLAALPTPAQAAPWRDGFGDASARIMRSLEWRFVSWLARTAAPASPRLINVRANEGTKIVP
jgi:hypothetical protein